MYDISGEKKTVFGRTLHALGVVVDLRQLAKGSLLVCNVQHRGPNPRARERDFGYNREREDLAGQGSSHGGSHELREWTDFLGGSQNRASKPFTQY